MKKLVTDLFTSSDGNTWEWASIQGALAFSAFLIFAFYHYIVLKTPFDPVGFGTGTGAIAAGTGAHKILSGKADAIPAE